MNFIKKMMKPQEVFHQLIEFILVKRKYDLPQFIQFYAQNPQS
jgi:hypothetical protein